MRPKNNGSPPKENYMFFSWSSFSNIHRQKLLLYQRQVFRENPESYGTGRDTESSASWRLINMAACCRASKVCWKLMCFWYIIIACCSRVILTKVVYFVRCWGSRCYWGPKSSVGLILGLCGRLENRHGTASGVWRRIQQCRMKYLEQRPPYALTRGWIATLCMEQINLLLVLGNKLAGKGQRMEITLRRYIA